MALIDIPLVSYGKNHDSVTASEEHKQVANCADMKHFSAAIRNLKETLGRRCRYSDIACDYWIELVPV